MEVLLHQDLHLDDAAGEMDKSDAKCAALVHWREIEYKPLKRIANRKGGRLCFTS